MSESKQSSSTEKFILRALVISLALHLLAFSLWRVGQSQGWWQNLAMPRWMQALSKLMMPVTPKKAPVEPPPPSTQLTFVEVDPALATTEPPKNPKFEGAKNTMAANKEIKKTSDMPDIDGHQDKFLKTVEKSTPTPPPAAKPTPPPKPATPPAPKPLPHETAPKQSEAPGDLAMNKPADKTMTGKTDVEPGEKTPTTAQAQPQTPSPPVHERPRTLDEARALNGTVGERSRQTGGVSHVAADTSLDVKGTPFGDYLNRMVEAVDSRWHKLLENQSTELTGKVVLRFRLHSDGRITDMTILKNEVGDLMEIYCERGIKDPAPYGKWPDEMLRDVANDHYDITFTFYYGID